MEVGTHSVTVLLGKEPAGSTWWSSMLLQTTFLSPLFERSSKDLQSDEPPELRASSAATTTEHHSRSGPILAAPGPELVPSGSATGGCCGARTRLQTEPPAG